MGVLNVTPDSFSDGGLWFEPTKALTHAEQLLEEGADLVDVGGESTRPGAERPPVEEELRRVLPVIEELTKSGASVSIDTMRAEVVEQALEAGAQVINDVSGGLADARMLEVAARAEVPFVAMHWRGHSTKMDSLATYDDVVSDVLRELHVRVEAALSAGVKPDRLIIDPGLGFAKNAEHNWALLAHLERFVESGYPVLVAASRKRFLGSLLADQETGEPRPVLQRDAASAAVSTLAAAAGAWCVRVHEVGPSADAVRVVARWAHDRGGPGDRPHD